MRSNAFASAAALAATFVMASAPLGAVERPLATSPAASVAMGLFDADAVNVHQYRYRYHHHDRVDAGTVIGAVVALGAIAAVASAVSDSSRDRNSDYHHLGQQDPYPEQRNGYRSPAPDARFEGGRGVDDAVEACAREVEHTARIDTIDNVDRAGEGWHVSGELTNGAAFDCSIGSDGRLDGVDYGNGYRGSDATGASLGRQLDDDQYASARSAEELTAPGEPGSPPESVPDQDDDGRYDTAQSPDFNG